MIEFQHVRKVYANDVTALDDVTFTVPTGEFAFVVGHSGSGKSTLLRLLTREERASGGMVVIDRKVVCKVPTWRVPALRRSLGVVFQDFKLLANKTARENVSFALEVIGHRSGLVRERTEEVLDLVGLREQGDRYPSELSGGEQQRVCIARALANHPPLLLCDEPTGNLDPGTSRDIMRLLEQINADGTTVLMATHDQSLVDAGRKRVIQLEHGKLIRDDAQGVYEVG